MMNLVLLQRFVSALQLLSALLDVCFRKVFLQYVLEFLFLFINHVFNVFSRLMSHYQCFHLGWKTWLT